MEVYSKDTMVVSFDVRSSFLRYIHVSHFWLSIDNQIVFLYVHSLCRLLQISTSFFYNFDFETYVVDYLLAFIC